MDLDSLLGGDPCADVDDGVLKTGKWLRHFCGVELLEFAFGKAAV